MIACVDLYARIYLYLTYEQKKTLSFLFLSCYIYHFVYVSTTKKQELYREIVSQARPVAASIRAIEKEKSANNQQEIAVEGEETDSKEILLEDVENSSFASGGGSNSSSTSGSNSNKNNKEESATKGLERRYHLLYLKAIEVQCMLENLLERRQSPVSQSQL